MDKTLTNQAIALAGLSQAIYLVQQIAKHGSADPDDTQVVIASTLKIDAEDVLDVYGGLAGLRTGLKQLDKQLSEPKAVDRELARYASTLILLEQQLMKNPAMVEAIGVAVSRANISAEKTGNLLDDEVFEALAYGYQNNLSFLKPRVVVSGEQRFLAEPRNAARIRALLLAGVRSVVLWRQAGGVRWKLLFLRTNLQREAKGLLATLEA
jgi:high frequency lysogenization protein